MILRIGIDCQAPSVIPSSIWCISVQPISSITRQTQRVRCEELQTREPAGRCSWKIRRHEAAQTEPSIPLVAHDPSSIHQNRFQAILFGTFVQYTPR